jgi:hypothetical protein
MTNELEGDFYDLATVEREIRNDVAVYETEKLNPLQFAVRIRLHPTLSITSQMKMRNAINAEMSYSLARPQTIYFHHKDKDWLEANLRAARELISAIRNAGIEHSQVEGSYLFREVNQQLVLKFLDQYGFHELNHNMKKSLLKGYIAAQSQQTPSSLRDWNVAVVSQRKSPRGTLDLGFGGVPLLSRSRLKGGRTDDKTADLKAIMSNSDLVLDLSPRPDLKSGASQLVKRRSDLLKVTGLLLLYPIAKDSQPDRAAAVGKEETREPLDAAEHMIGVALVFPEASKDTPQGYMTAKIPDSVYVEEIEDADLSEAL